MANQKITDLTALVGADVTTTDVLPIVDVSADETKKITTLNLSIGMNASRFLGNWNATTNSPTLVSSTGNEGDTYLVSVGGSTTLDGISTWVAGDYCFFQGGAWQREVGLTGLENVFIQIGATAGGDLSGTYVNPTVAKLGGDSLPANAANGFLKRNSGNTAWEEVAYGSASNTVTVGNDSRLSDSRAPNGSAGGDLTGTYPNPTIGTNKVTNSQSAQMATLTIKGNNTGSTANAADLTAAQTKTLLALDTALIQFPFGDGSSVIAANDVCIIGPMPFAGTITEASIFSDISTSAVVDLWKDVTANYPPTVADTITASAKPTLSASLISTDSTLTGWTKTFAIGDYFIAHVDSNNNAKSLNLGITVTR